MIIVHFKQIEPKSQIKIIQRTQEEHDKIEKQKESQVNKTSQGYTPENLKDLLLHNLDEFKEIENLLSNEEKEFRQIGNIYSDLHYGDYLLVFQNPDEPSLVNNREVTFQECSLIYEECLTVKTDNQSDRNDMIKEKIAFLTAFKELVNYQPVQKQKKKRKDKTAQDNINILLQSENKPNQQDKYSQSQDQYQQAQQKGREDIIDESENLRLTLNNEVTEVVPENIEDDIPVLEYPQIPIGRQKVRETILQNETLTRHLQNEDKIAQDLLEQFRLNGYQPKYKMQPLPGEQKQQQEESKNHIYRQQSSDIIEEVGIDSEIQIKFLEEKTNKIPKLSKFNINKNKQILNSSELIIETATTKTKSIINSNNNNNKNTIQKQKQDEIKLQLDLIQSSQYQQQQQQQQRSSNIMSIQQQYIINEADEEEDELQEAYINKQLFEDIKKYQKFKQNQTNQNQNLNWFSDETTINQNFYIDPELIKQIEQMQKEQKQQEDEQNSEKNKKEEKSGKLVDQVFTDFKNIGNNIANNLTDGFKQIGGGFKQIGGRFIKIGGRISKFGGQLGQIGGQIGGLIPFKKKNILAPELAALKKSYSSGGLLNKEFLTKKDFDWQYSSTRRTGDFLTLIRNCIILKLAKAGLHTRMLLTSDGKYIIILVKANEQILKKFAHQVKFRKQLELGSCDLFSLEPVDESYRPLRLKDFINQQNKNESLGDFQGTKSEGGIKDVMKRTYQLIKKLPEAKLKQTLLQKVSQLDIVFDKIEEELRCNFIKENGSTVINDIKIQREQWEIYFIYLDYLQYYYGKLNDFRKIKEKQLIDKQQQLQQKGQKGQKYYQEFQDQLGYLMRLIFIKAKNEANQLYFETHKISFLEFFGIPTASKCILKNIFDYIDVLPFPPYANYQYSSKNNQEDDQLHNIWRNFEISETGQRSIFSNMERLKITNIIIQKIINIPKLLNRKIVANYLPLHDCYELEGIKKEDLFKSFFEQNILDKQHSTAGSKQLKEFHKFIQDKQSKHDNDTQSLVGQTRFNIYRPWYLPIDSIREYFGEKIALYFSFLAFYTKQLFVISFLGLIAQSILNQKLPDSKEFQATLLIFSLVITAWSSTFTELWKREQYRFCIRYGQEEYNKEETERPSFEGKFQRSIGKEMLNQKFYSNKKRILKKIYSLLLSFIILIVVIFIVFMLFLLKDFFIKNQIFKDTGFVFLESTIPSILNSIQILIFNEIYQNVAIRCNEYENHATLTSYENSLIAKIFAFVFVNTFNSLFIISFLKEQLNWNCTFNNCFSELQGQMQSIFLVNFVKNGLEIGQPLLKQYRRKANMVLDENPNEHIFNEIDSYLEKQFILEPYKTTDELDGTIGDYMEMVVQYSFLSLFGLSFPLCFLLALINNIAEIQVDKIKIFRFSQRPIPQGTHDIGTWYFILQFISIISIFTNAGLVTFTSHSVQKTHQMRTFLIQLLGNLFVKYIVQFIIPDKSSKIVLLRKRYNVVINKFLKGLQSTKNSLFKQIKPNCKVGNVATLAEGNKIYKQYLKDKNNSGFQFPNLNNIFKNKNKVTN